MESFCKSNINFGAIEQEVGLHWQRKKFVCGIQGSGKGV